MFLGGITLLELQREIETEILPLASGTGSIRDPFLNPGPLFHRFPVVISRKWLSQKIKYCILLRPVFSKYRYHEQIHICFQDKLSGSFQVPFLCLQDFVKFVFIAYAYTKMP
jgi:hypothetical protein